MSNSALELVLSKLERVKQLNPHEWEARCPAHKDTTPSLSVGDGGDRALVHCHGGCSQEAVIAALGLKPADLFCDNNGAKAGRGQIVQEYDYTDENGVLLFQVVRFEPKDFRQRKPDGNGGWEWKLGDTRRVPYRLPQVVEAVGMGKTIHICEGEKDVHAIEGAGGVATTCPGGAGKWRGDYNEAFHGAQVRIVQDDDDAGRAHARKVADALQGVAASVEILSPLHGKDAADHIGAGHTLDEFVVAKDGGAGEEERRPVFVLLSTLRQNPELLTPPEFVIPRVVCSGRASVLAAREKSGKSTLLAQLASDKSQGRRCLGEPITPGRVLWVGLEESLNDAVRRFEEMDANPDQILLATYTPTDPFGEVRSILDVWPADIIVVDSLYALAMASLGKVPDSGDAATWGTITRPLVGLSRDYGVGSITSHHAGKADGTYRDSTEIGAAFDAIYTLRMPKPGEDPTLRRIEGQGRWHIEPFSVAFREGRYDLDHGGELSLDALLLIHIENEPGIFLNRLVELVKKRKQTVSATLNQLEARGAIENRGSEARAAYYPPSNQHDLEGL